jgi:hypothetical protein
MDLKDTVEKMSSSAAQMGQLGCADEAEEADFHGFFFWLSRADLLPLLYLRSSSRFCQLCPDISRMAGIFQD